MSVDIETWRCGGPPAHGQWQRYPGRFLYNVRTTYPDLLGEHTLHMFAGSMATAGVKGTTTDVRAEAKPDVVADYDDLPFDDDSFDHVLADPPYANHWANQWHADLPKPGRILHEAARVVKPGGLIGILHLIVVPAYKTAGVERIALHPVLCGPNNACRVFNVFRVE